MLKVFKINSIRQSLDHSENSSILQTIINFKKLIIFSILLQNHLRMRVFHLSLILLGSLLSHGCKMEENVDVLENKRMIKIIQKTLTGNSNAIDVGCYKGEILEQMIASSPEGIHYAFEPIPGLYNDLIMNFKNKNVRIENMALGEKSGEEEFMHVLSNEPYSGFRQRKYERPDEKIEKIRVRVEPLDKIIPSDLPISFIKIDVEGAELLVLRGGAETIKRNKPVIIFEHGQGASEFYDTKPEDVYSFLHDEMGLEINTLQEYLEGKSPLNRENFLEMYYKSKAYNYVAYPLK